MTPPPLPDWLHVIRTCGPELPAWTIHQVREIGAAAREPLVALLQSADLSADPVEPADHAANHAIALLGELGHDDAVAKLCLERLHANPHGTHAFALTETLVRFGPAVAPAALASYDALLDDETAAGDFVKVLARCGARGDAIHDALLDALERFPNVSGEIGHSGDVRFVKPLERVIEAWEPTEFEDLMEDETFNDSVLGAAQSLRMLGAELSPTQMETIAHEEDEVSRWAEGQGEPQEPWVAGPRPGPNAPCWCGSERKYKKCHMASDAESDADATT